MRYGSTSLMRRAAAAAVIAAALALPFGAGAEPGDRGRAHEHYDERHGHNHYYPERGLRVRELPREARPIAWHGERYWFHEGVWYRPIGPRFVVVAPPFGVFVPVLPAFATLVVIGGTSFYYANDAYYRYDAARGGYEVVAPPEGAPVAATAPASAPPPGEDLFVYPRNGQNPDQQARDRYECHRWAADQTGFDPTRPAGGVDPAAAVAKRGEYRRAQQACLEARGYTVR